MGDLRAEVGEELARQVKEDWRSAPLNEPTRALLEFAEKITREPGKLRASDVERLRARGLDDEAIHDAAQAIAYFNYINRVADALGVDLEVEMPPDPRTPPG